MQGYREDDGLYLESDTDEQVCACASSAASRWRLALLADGRLRRSPSLLSTAADLAAALPPPFCQLLIHIPFNTACKLSGLVIKSTKEGQVGGGRAHLLSLSAAALLLCMPARLPCPRCRNPTTCALCRTRNHAESYATFPSPFNAGS